MWVLVDLDGKYHSAALQSASTVWASIVSSLVIAWITTMGSIAAVLSRGVLCRSRSAMARWQHSSTPRLPGVFFAASRADGYR